MNIIHTKKVLQSTSPKGATILKQGFGGKKWLTLEEASEYTGYSKSSLYKFHSSGKILASKPGGKLLRFRIEELDRFLSGEEVSVESLNTYKS